MKFETNSQLILTQDEMDIIDKALVLCRNMDSATEMIEDETTGLTVGGCDICPFKNKCSKQYSNCVYYRAHEALKEIFDIAIVK